MPDAESHADLRTTLVARLPADIEAFNRRWQEAVWQRFTFQNRDEVVTQSQQAIAAHRDRHAVRIEDAPKRRLFPANWQFNLQHPLRGVVIFIRVTSLSGRATVLDQTFDVSPTWCGRLVRAEVDLTAQEIRFYALRRKDPDNHVLLGTPTNDPQTILGGPWNTDTHDIGGYHKVTVGY